MATWTPNEQTVFVGPRATSFTVVCEACRALGDGRALSGAFERTHQRATFSCRNGHRLRIVRALPLPALG